MQPTRLQVLVKIVYLGVAYLRWDAEGSILVVAIHRADPIQLLHAKCLLATQNASNVVINLSSTYEHH